MYRIRLKLFASLIVLIFTMSLFPYVRVNASENYSGTCGDSLSWELDSEGLLSISGTGDMYNYAFSNDQDVSPWYDCCELIKTVVISSGVTSIGDNAFNGCYYLKDITLPDSVTSIGEGAFMYCSGLSGITLPDSVTSIGDGAFSCCESLTSITIPDGVTTIGNCVFSECSSLTSITIPEDVTSIGDNAFDSCSSLTSISIPENVISIGAGAFTCCESLTSITIPENLTSIGEYAFEYCSSLTDITIPESVTSIGANAFADCYSLISMNIPGSVSSIDEGAFIDCYSLTSVTITDGVTSIGESAFYLCNKLTSIIIPDSVTSIGDDAFYYCSNLESVTISNRLYNSENNNDNTLKSLSSDKLNLYFTVVFEIGDHGEVGIESRDYETRIVTLYVTPDSDYEVDEITVTDTNGTEALTPVNGVYSVDISDGDVTVNTTFKVAGNFILASGTCGDELTWELNDDGVLTISGTGSMDDYSNAAPWRDSKDLIKSVVVSSGVTSIGNYAFWECSNLTSITIPDSVNRIGNYAFEDCTSLTGINIPEDVTSIGTAVFYDCTSLTSITLPDSLTTIGEYAFQSCTGLTSITIPDGVTEIKDSAFCGCTNLESITIPDSVNFIGFWVFSGCTKLESVSVSNRLFNSGKIKDSTLKSLDSEYLNLYYSVDFSTGENGEVGIESRDYETGIVTLYVTPDSDYEVDEISVTDTNGTAAALTPVNGVYSVDTSAGDVTVTTTFKASVLASGTCGDDLSWELNTEGVLTVSGTGEMDNYVYSDYLAPWYGNRSSIKSVVISSGVTSIGEKAFFYCANLKAITIPESVTSIGGGAFYYCSNLESVTISNRLFNSENNNDNTLKSLSSDKLDLYFTVVFETGENGMVEVISRDSETGIVKFSATPDYGYAVGKVTVTAADTGDTETITPVNGIYTVNISNEDLTVTTTFRLAYGTCGDTLTWTLDDQGLLTISGTGDMTDYYYPDNLAPWWYDSTEDIKSVVIGSGVTSIGDRAFNDCGSITSITIPDSVTSIGNGAFAACQSLTSIDIPESVTSIDEGAFANCSSLTSIKIPDGVTSIGVDTFCYCTAITSITIPDSVTSIGEFAFLGCRSLISITIPDGVTSIEDGTFFNCNNLESITFPASVKSFGDAVFDYCDSLTDIYYLGTKAQFGKEYLFHNGIVFHYGTNPLKLLTQPSNLAGTAGSTVTFRVGAEGEGIQYKWQYYYNGKWNTAAAKTSTYNVTVKNSLNGMKVRCVLSDQYGNTETTKEVVLTVKQPAKITTQPEDCKGLAGSTVTFSVVAEGEGLQYKWQYFYNEKWNTAAAKTSTYNVTVKNSLNGMKVRCIVTDPYGTTVTSREAVLTVSQPAKITSQPVDCKGVAGGTVTFSVGAEGEGLQYKWQYYYNGKWNTAAAKTSAYNVTVKNSLNGMKVRCIVTDEFGTTVTSQNAVLTVSQPAKITSQPVDCKGLAGSTVTFSVGAEGEGLQYKWQYYYNSKWNTAAAKTSAYNVTVKNSLNGMKVRCIVTDEFGTTVTSQNAVLTVSQPAKITSQPVDCKGLAGSTVTFSVGAEGEGLQYKWQYYYNGKWNTAAAKTSTYNVTVKNSLNGMKVRCIVTDEFGTTVTSQTVSLTVSQPAKITGQPEDCTVQVGKSVTFSVGAEGEGLQYKWQYYYNGKWNTAAAKTSTYTVNARKSLNGMKVRCIVTDEFGTTVVSREAVLTVT